MLCKPYTLWIFKGEMHRMGENMAVKTGQWSKILGVHSHDRKCQEIKIKNQSHKEASQACVQPIFRGRLGKGCGRSLVLFQYMFITKIMPKEKSSNFGNPIWREYFVWFVTNGCGCWTLSQDGPDFRHSGLWVPLSLHIRQDPVLD